MDRVLFIRPDGIGDMVCALPAFTAVRAAHRSAHIAVLASPLNAPILEHNPDVDEVLIYDARGGDRSLLARLRWMSRVRRMRFTCVFALRTATDTHAIAAASGAPMRVGYADKPFHPAFTHSERLGNRPGSIREIERNLRLLALVGVSARAAEPQMPLSSGERAAADESLGALRGSDAPFIGVHPGASSDDKRFPESRYADALNAATGSWAIAPHVLVFSGPGDEKRSRELASRLSLSSTVLAGLSLREMAAVASRCRMMVANDSGPMHIAAAVGTPLVAIFGHTDHVRWMPQSPTARLVRADSSQPDSIPLRPGMSLVETIPTAWVERAISELWRHVGT